VATIKAEIDVLAKQIDSFQDNVADARGVVNRYDEILTGVQARYDTLEKRIPVWINSFYFVMTAFLVWLLISQAGMLLYGIYLLS
jgi:hypothetical protein